jgi:hypothetical protein
VASYCSKCGTELSAGTQACTACGEPVVALAAAPVPPQPAAPPARSGNNALKIVLIVLAVFIGLGILGAGAFTFFVWRVAHNIHMSGSGDQVTVSTPGGTISANASDTNSAADLGADVYPGATQGKGGVRMKLPTGTMVTAVYFTADSKDKVLAYYKSKFGESASIYDSGDGTVLSLTKGAEETVVITITKGTGNNEGKTEVHIVHTTAVKPS